MSKEDRAELMSLRGENIRLKAAIEVLEKLVIEQDTKYLKLLEERDQEEEQRADFDLAVMKSEGLI